jgi:hypothetical protein
MLILHHISKKMKIKIFFLCILLSCFTKTYSQEIDLNVDNFNKTTLTADFLNRGSLIGTEVKTLLGARSGMPLCFGLSGVCAMLNLPLHPANKSSYFKVKIIAKGARKIYASIMAYTGIVIRYKGFSKLTGGSYLSVNGTKTIDNWNTGNSIIHIESGFHNPFS